jgi:protoheme IX farnesyltransferase
MNNVQYWRDLFELTKPRICLLALMMAALGYFCGNAGQSSILALFVLLVGLGFIGAASGILNQYLERDIDARMWRTMNRPLPAERFPQRDAIVWGFVLAILGEMILLIAVNSITAVLGALTLFLYLAVYTPAKRVSSLSTLIGAIPGAMPPLMGFTASYGRIGPEGFLLFVILFLWQIPHFLAIAWIYREDYRRADLPILSVVDVDGDRTAKHVILYSAALCPLTLVPAIWGVTGPLYFAGAVLLGLLLFACGMCLAVKRNVAYARLLVVASILYLPALGLMMVWDRVA